MNDGIYFWHAYKHQSFLQVDTIILGVRIQTCPNTQNNKIVVSLQYLKKEMSGDVDFLLTDKHESFLQIDTKIFDGDGQTFPKFPK